MNKQLENISRRKPDSGGKRFESSVGGFYTDHKWPKNVWKMNFATSRVLGTVHRMSKNAFLQQNMAC